MAAATSLSDDEEYTIPLQDKRVFGAWIKRRRVLFVPASQSEGLSGAKLADFGRKSESGKRESAAERYLGIVLGGGAGAESGDGKAGDDDDGGKRESEREEVATASTALLPSQPKARDTQKEPESGSPSIPSQPSEQHTTTKDTPRAPPESFDIQPCEALPDPATMTESNLCPTCRLPLPSSPSTTHSHRVHRASTAHQASLPHHFPPNHLPRETFAARYLASYGYDPDAHVGLGPEGREGKAHPVKVREKGDTVGLGASVSRRRPETGLAVEGSGGDGVGATNVKRKGREGKLDAGQAREMAKRERERGLRMQELLFGRGEEVEALLRERTAWKN